MTRSSKESAALLRSSGRYHFAAIETSMTNAMSKTVAIVRDVAQAFTARGPRLFPPVTFCDAEPDRSNSLYGIRRRYASERPQFCNRRSVASDDDSLARFHPIDDLGESRFRFRDTNSLIHVTSVL
jgi:hypothetical protein